MKGPGYVMLLAGLAAAGPWAAAQEPLAKQAQFRAAPSSPAPAPATAPSDTKAPFRTVSRGGNAEGAIHDGAWQDHVHIFAVNGIDPMCLGSFNGLCQKLRDQGYANTTFGQLYGSGGFSAKIRAIRQQDPHARIVLIGFSAGCNYARSLANSLGQEGIPIDLLIYLASDCIANTPNNRPGNCGQVLNITAHGLLLSGGDLFLKGCDLDGARNHRLNTRHMQVPTRPETLQLILEELSDLGPVAPLPTEAVPPTKR